MIETVVTVRRILVPMLLMSIFLGFTTSPAGASRAPTSKEAKAIERGFMKPRSQGKTKIEKIRVSTEKAKFAAVSYSVTIPEVTTIGPVPARRSSETYKAPSPAVLEKKGGKWKTVPKAPGKVKKDLKAKPKARIDILGETAAVLSVPATCSDSPGFYSAGIYDPIGDVYLSIEIPSYAGHGTYPAMAVHAVAALAVGNMGGVPQWETGQGYDAFEPSGEIYVDPGGWGRIAATMARTGGVYPQSVTVRGYWDCK